jgi:hypothetical protein
VVRIMIVLEGVMLRRWVVGPRCFDVIFRLHHQGFIVLGIRGRIQSVHRNSALRESSVELLCFSKKIPFHVVGTCQQLVSPTVSM